MHPSAHRIVGLYDQNAEHWDQDRGKVLIEKSWLDRFLDVAPSPGEILDIGCGSGDPVGRYLIGKGRPLTGLDSSPSMIALCQKRWPDRTWVIADMRTFSLGKSYAGLLAWNSFFHLSPEDQTGMFPRFAAHAMPGAALMFTSGPAHGEAIGLWRGEDLYHASLDPQEYRTLLAGHGFEVVDHMIEDPDCGGHTVWLARRL